MKSIFVVVPVVKIKLTHSVLKHYVGEMDKLAGKPVDD